MEEKIVDEIWKDIAGYEGLYQVSNMGRVKSVDTKIISKNGVIKNKKGKIRKLLNHNNGYKIIRLVLSDRIKYVHRLVLETFSPIEDMENLEINHKDCNKSNNHLENLEWSTHKENIIHSVKQGRHPKGEAVGSAKLTEEDVKWIRLNYIPFDKNFSVNAIAKKFGRGKNTIQAIVKRRTWKHIP